ncbi:hypothetical protein PG987_002200 [Apiospora arundinis]
MAVAVRTLRILHFWVPGCTSVRALPYMQLWCNGKTLDVMHDSSHLSWEHPAVTAYIAYMNALRPTREPISIMHDEPVFSPISGQGQVPLLGLPGMLCNFSPVFLRPLYSMSCRPLPA